MVIRDPDLSILCLCHSIAAQTVLFWAMEGRRESGEAPANEIQNDTSSLLSISHQWNVVMWPHLDAKTVWNVILERAATFWQCFDFMERVVGGYSLQMVGSTGHCWGQSSLSISYLYTSWGQHTDCSLFQHLFWDVCIAISLGRCRVSRWEQSVGMPTACSR